MVRGNTRGGAQHHGPRKGQRQPKSSYSSEFLRGLEARREVVRVDEDWGHDIDDLPANAKWVIYPNGDLERIAI